MAEKDEKLEDQELPEDNKGNKKEAEEEDDLTPEEIKSSRSLYKALKDPETANELIENLARRAGLLDKKGKNTEDKKETVKELGRITRKLKASLGKEFEGFSDKVGPVFDEAMQEYMEEHFGKTEAKFTETKWEGEVDKFRDSHELTRKIENKMKELMDEAPPNFKSGSFDAQKYLNRIYKNALEDSGEEAPKKSSKRSKDNENDNNGIVERQRPKTVSVDDAIDAAMKGIRFKN